MYWLLLIGSKELQLREKFVKATEKSMSLRSLCNLFFFSAGFFFQKRKVRGVGFPRNF
jgi:hypothetical protein